ncbi:Telomere repeat-binding protein 4 [Dendrobium catenatum]|uniref:Telomere repeat-binding protein 4 n=2 Tax=Dendrobium catenatum TaxID=906689 RepID=A0A2I0WPS0_9ASPA|nr:Telomere repeat-binding protein 4 [Dendrobium catenatum]
MKQCTKQSSMKQDPYRKNKGKWLEVLEPDLALIPNDGGDAATDKNGSRGGIPSASPNEETIEVGHLLVPPHVTRALDEDPMYLSSKSLENCLNVGGTPCSDGYYDQGNDYGILVADAEQVEIQALKYEFMLQEPEENENPHITCNLSCDCSDYLLEAVSAETFMDYPSNSEATVRNMEYTSQVQCMDRDVDEVKPDYIARTFAIATLDHSTGAPDSTKFLSHDTLHGTFFQNASLEAQKWLKHELLLFDQQNLTELGNVCDQMDSAFLSSENEDDMILIPGNEIPERVFSSFVSLPHTGALVSSAAKNELPYRDGQAALDCRGQEILGTTNDSMMTTKRLRKPTRRYIEESSETKPRSSYDRLKTSLISSKEKLLHARAAGKCRWSGAVQLLYQDYPGRVHSLRGFRRKRTKQLENDGKGYNLTPESAKISCFQDSELQDDPSDEHPTRVHKRRKHHRQWTHSEVAKLVDGVSQYGVGRWTEIKRLFFSTSSYRTAVDLKDKWRNLLRASLADPANKNLVEPQKKHASAPMPESILQRVRELSIIHPYPRSQKSTITDLPILPPPTSLTNTEDALNRSGRILHRLSFS